MTLFERISEILTAFGEPMRVRDIAALIPDIPRQYVQNEINRVSRQGRLERVGHGLYQLPGAKTLSQVTDIEVASDVRPVVPEGRKVELKPQQGHRTVNLLLEVIARADDPKPYAGVLREISDTLVSA